MLLVRAWQRTVGRKLQGFHFLHFPRSEFTAPSLDLPESPTWTKAEAVSLNICSAGVRNCVSIIHLSIARPVLCTDWDTVLLPSRYCRARLRKIQEEVEATVGHLRNGILCKPSTFSHVVSTIVSS
ncbi:unnamed protein product [Pleuronectes platessa]|uniref:Uncharacterized protein n=1 Tax=Pleuronectes platessa TaxID=8262 RepID=A0A9N7YTF2_PLEPL|nr:unnamed protein product [Pleuronectes platessa]